MAADFVARLGSRASVPGEVRSRWGVPEYVAGLMAREEGVAEQLHRLVHRDARSLRRLDAARLTDLLRALAAPPSAELNKAALGAAAGIPATTITPYLDALVELGVVRMLPGCRATVAKRAIGRPRVVFDDPSVARHLAGVKSEQLAEFGGRRALAPLLEGAVIAELLRQQPTSAVTHRLSHLRERNGLEVDVVVELPDGTVYGLEVRTAASIRPHQFRSLEALAARAGARFRGGVVLNTAAAGHQYRPGLWALPVSSLWDWDVAVRG